MLTRTQYVYLLLTICPLSGQSLRVSGGASAGEGYFRLTEESGVWRILSPDGMPVPADLEITKQSQSQLGSNRKSSAPLFAIADGVTGLALFPKLADSGGRTIAFPDPFDPAWESQVSQSLAADSKVAGWLVVPPKTPDDLYRFVYSRYCGSAFRDWLEAKYLGINLLNVAWNVRYESFESFMAIKPEPAENHGPMYEDFQLFTGEVFEQFSKVLIGAVRRSNPRALVFSAAGPADGVIASADPATLRRIFERTGRPIIVMNAVHPEDVRKLPFVVGLFRLDHLAQ